MKKIMFIMLILLLFITCSAVWAADNVTDEIIADSDDCINLQSSQENDFDQSDEVLKTNDSNVEGGYVDASEAYEYLNAFRTEENVWYWNADDVTQSHVNTNDTVWLKPLKRDIELENTAKIRAKEISEYFGHVRPDGTYCFSIFPDNLLDYGENIAYGYETGHDVTEGWKETDMSYEGQGHRRGMLQAAFNYVGIAGYKVDGVIYWVQNFGCRYDPEDVDVRFTAENNTLNPKFSVNLPKYASGSFDIYVNGTLISTKSISNGKSEIPVCGLNQGTYEILLSYSGDYNCRPFNQSEIIVIPDHENSKDTLTFNHLNTLIQMAGDKIRLENDYEFKTDIDSSFSYGIEISKYLTIDGQGHSVDAKNVARIFDIGFYEVTLKNIRLINANLPSEKRYFDSSAYGVTCYSNFRPIRDGGAVFSRFPISIVNSTFSNSIASNGAAVFAYSDVYVDNSTFENNSADIRGGAIYSFIRVYVTNTTFKDNHAVDVGGAIYSGLIVDATDSVFINNHNRGIFTKEFISSNNTIVYGEYIDFFANATSDNGIVTLNRNLDAIGTVLINASNVIIDGRGYTIDAKGKSRLFNITGDNITIKNLRFINGKSISEGGAIHVSSSRLTILNSTFENCIAQYGGVVYGNCTDILIKDCTFKNNELNDYSGNEIAEGGVITTRTGDVFISSSTFTNNSAFYGAVVHTDSGNISLLDSSFKNNHALYYGGIVHTTGNVIVLNSDFSNNYASLYGGAIFCYEESGIFVKNSTFTNNTSHHYGGAISAAVEAEIVDCVFRENFAKDYGGAICLWGNLSVSNSNFTNNTAQVASAIFDYYINGSVTITGSNFINNTQMTLGTLYFTTDVFVRNSTFANNRAYDGVGGAIVSEQNLTVLNSIFTNNSAVRSWGYSVGGAIASYGENLNVEDSLFADSHVMRGGAIANFAKNASIRNSIFANNSAEKDGGAIFSYDNTICSVSDSIFENNSAEDGGALCGADAVNCTFTQNRATNLASAMYGVSNTAENCRFIKNFDYTDEPVYGVATTDCTFKDNRLIIKAFFEYALKLAYYQGENIRVDVLNYLDRTPLPNATVTIRAYKDNVLAGEFEYLSGDGWIVNITEGDYTFQFSIENQDYEINPINATVKIIKKEIADIQIAMGDNVFLDPTVAKIISNVDGTITVYIDDYYMEYLDVAANSSVQLTYNYISVGNHTLKVVMNPSDYHIDSKTFSKNFTVLKKPTSVTLNVENTKNTENVIVRINASEYGNVIVRVWDIEESVYVSAGIEQQINFGIFKTGAYVARAIFVGDENYLDSNASKTFNVLDTITQNDIKISNDNLGNLSISLPSDATGTLTLSIAGNNYNVEIVDGVAEVILPDSLKGENSYVITYSGDEKYSGFSIEGTLNGDFSKIKPDIAIGLLTEDGQVKLPSDAKGTVTLTIDDTDYVFDVVDGIANVILPDLANGIHQYTITYSGDDKYMSFAQTDIISVDRPIIITAGNVKLTYGAGSYYTITVKNDLGIAESGADVVIYINSKKFKTLKTDSNGMCSFKVSQLPGTYNLKIASKTISVTKTLTVKHLVTLKSVTVKRSAKKLVLTATLGKINNKYLKNKKITFNFNGKKYTAKTDKKGVAKVTIKSSVLKKLKVGKKLTYQATYSKDTVKKTVKIKK